MEFMDLITQIHQAIPLYALALVFGLIVLVNCIMIAVFFFHWDRYGTNSITTFKLKTYYLIGVICFLGLAVYSLILY